MKHVELDALLAAPQGYADDVPIDPDFHARRLPESAWRNSRKGVSRGVEAVIQLHRLREGLALAGFTRFEAFTPDIHAEYETDVERADLASEPTWFPAVENRGDGLFLQLDPQRIDAWIARPAVQHRVDRLDTGHRHWLEQHQSSKLLFPGGPYVLLHTISHLLIQSLALRCGYPARSIRERIYADAANRRFGLLLYTSSPDAEGTLGGLVQQARHIEAHLAYALRAGALCSNDPICAEHEPGESMEKRWLHGAACHGCVLAATIASHFQTLIDRSLLHPLPME